MLEPLSTWTLCIKEPSMSTSITGALRFKDISFTSTILAFFLTKEELNSFLHFGAIANNCFKEICGYILSNRLYRLYVK
jgi:hypothetical protein